MNMYVFKIRFLINVLLIVCIYYIEYSCVYIYPKFFIGVCECYEVEIVNIKYLK